MVRFIVLAFFFILSLANIQAQDSTSYNPKRLRNYGIAGGLTYGGTLVALNSLWYQKNDQQSFKFFNDFPQWKQVDKVGHAFSCYHLSRFSSDILEHSGVNKKKSAIYGSMIGFLLLSPIELLDGYSKSYGASYGDLIFNGIGSGFYLTQKLIFKKIKVMPKFSFHPTRYPKDNPNLLGNGIHEEILKDYNGQSYWLSVNLNEENEILKWINLSFGYGAEDMLVSRDIGNRNLGLSPSRQYYLGLELNLTHIKSKRKSIKALLYILEGIKIPGPSLILQNEKILFRGIYF